MRAWHRNLVPDPHSSRTAHVLDCIGSRAIIIPRLTSCVMKATEFHSVTGAAEGINKGSSILPAAGALEAAEAVGGYQEGKVIPSVLLPGSKRSINSVLSKCKTSKHENTDKPLSSFINSFINFSKLYLPGQTHHPKATGQPCSRPCWNVATLQQTVLFAVTESGKVQKIARDAPHTAFSYCFSSSVVARNLSREGKENGRKLYLKRILARHFYLKYQKKYHRKTLYKPCFWDFFCPYFTGIKLWWMRVKN